MKLQLIAFTAVVLQSAIPGALSAEPRLRAPSGPKPKKDVSMLISTADAAVAVTADYEEEKARSGALSSAEPHIRAPSGPKAKGDIKVAMPTAMAGPKETPNCCVGLSKEICLDWSAFVPCEWKPPTWMFGSGYCGGHCDEYEGCYCSAEGEGHFDFNEAMEKAMFDSSEDTDTGSEFF